MEYKDPGRYVPVIFLLCSGVPGLGFTVKVLSGFRGGPRSRRNMMNHSWTTSVTNHISESGS